MTLAEAYAAPTFTLGNRIAKARKDAGLDQHQLAELVGVSRALVSKWERDVSIPDLVEAMTIADETKVTLYWLAGDRPISCWMWDAPTLSSVDVPVGQGEFDFDPPARPDLRIVFDPLPEPKTPLTLVPT